MALHGVCLPQNGMEDTTPSPASGSVVGTKRAASPASPQVSKKAKSGGMSPKPSPAPSSSDRVRTVIEVLNVPRIDSPLSRPISAMEPKKPAEQQSETTGAEGVVSTSAPTTVAFPQAEVADVATPTKETTPPVPLIQTDAVADGLVEASGKEASGEEASDTEASGKSSEAGAVGESPETKGASEAVDGDVVMGEAEAEAEAEAEVEKET